MKRLLILSLMFIALFASVTGIKAVSIDHTWTVEHFYSVYYQIEAEEVPVSGDRLFLYLEPDDDLAFAFGGVNSSILFYDDTMTYIGGETLNESIYEYTDNPSGWIAIGLHPDIAYVTIRIMIGIADPDAQELEDIVNLQNNNSEIYDTGHLVTFDTMGGTPEQYFLHALDGDNISNPTNIPGTITKDDHSFRTWYTDELIWDNEWDFDNDVVTDDMTLYAEWGLVWDYEELYNGYWWAYSEPTEIFGDRLFLYLDDDSRISFTSGGIESVYSFYDETLEPLDYFVIDDSLFAYTEYPSGWVEIPIIEDAEYISFSITYATQHPDTTTLSLVQSRLNNFARLYHAGHEITFDSTDAIPEGYYSHAWPNGLVEELSTTPVLWSYEFVGWVDEFSEEWLFDVDTVTSDITLYAEWNLIFWVGFHSMGGEPTPEPDTLFLEYGSTVPQPTPNPHIDGMVLVGWSTSTDCEVMWNFATDTITEEETILYACYEEVTPLNETIMDWLAQLGIDTAIKRTLLSIVLIALVSIGLGVLKVPNMIYIIVIVVMLFTFIALGILPTWLAFLVVILSLLIAYIYLRGLAV